MSTLICLALVVYYEARGEPLVGQIAVAQVVLNRADSALYGDDECSVMTEGVEYGRNRCQFSFYCDGRVEIPMARRAWRRAKAIAAIVRSGTIRIEELEDSLFYHGNYVTPYWSIDMQPKAHIGDHIFY